jgi:glutaredoxin
MKPIEVVLYTKEPCPLCDEAKRELESLAADHPYRLTEIDITSDPALFALYRYTIPVLHIGEREVAAPITRDKLRAALAAAG